MSLFCHWTSPRRLDNKKAVVDQSHCMFITKYSSLSASYSYLFVSNVPVFFLVTLGFSLYILFSSVLLCCTYVWFSFYPTWVFLGALDYCALMSFFSLGKFQAIISSAFFFPCSFFLLSSGTSVTWIIDHFTMSHMSLILSPSLTNLSPISPILFSSVAHLLNTCSFWLFYCLILNFSFDIFYTLQVFAEFFILFSISKKEKSVR